MINTNIKKDVIFFEDDYPKKFIFNAQVAHTFNNMATRSIPLYHEILHDISLWIERCIPRHGTIYDIGCATGALFKTLIRNSKKPLILIGIDNSLAMLKEAKNTIKINSYHQVIWKCEDAQKTTFSHANLICFNFTLQFIAINYRYKILSKAFDDLEANGMVYIGEKIKSNNTNINQHQEAAYYDFKNQNGYSRAEIDRKKNALNGVLDSITLEKYLKMLKKIGFVDIEVTMQWQQFIAIVARKPSSVSITNNKDISKTITNNKDTSKIITNYVDVSQEAVTIGHQQELTVSQHKQLLSTLRQFIPWKKGPFNIFGHFIDSEWRSDQKWNRIVQHCNIKDKVIADIGCNNGYYMFKMLAHNPAKVVGFEPVVTHYEVFNMLTGFCPQPKLHFCLDGVENINSYAEKFDTVLCLGILYHHKDPFGILKKIHMALQPHGQIIIDCQGMPGKEPQALMPHKRYAGAKGVWWVPTMSCIKNWLLRSHFKDVECFYAQPLSCQEQRTTTWAPINSLCDFIDKDDSTKTIEGYDAPWRFYFKATRG